MSTMAAMRIVLVLVAGLAVAALLPAAPVRADQAGGTGGLIQSVRIFDALVSFPPASWYTGGDPADSASIAGGQEGRQFVIRHLPKGETLDNWTRLYEISGYYLGEGHNHTVDTAAMAGVGPYRRLCTPNRLFMQVVAQDERSFTTLVYCESAGQGAGTPGYGPSVGEIGLIRSYLIGNTVLKAIHAWRGTLFLYGDQTTWPVGPDEINLMIRRFAALQAEPFGKP